MFLLKRTVITLLALFCGVIGAESAFSPGKWASWPAGGPAVTTSAAGWSFGGNNDSYNYQHFYNGSTNTADAYAAWGNPTDTRHNSTNNVLLVDGHVENMRNNTTQNYKVPLNLIKGGQ